MPNDPTPDPVPGYYLLSAGPHDGLTLSTTAHDGFTGLDHLRAWLCASTWGLRVSDPGRHRPQSGDRCCVFVTGAGIVATACVVGPAEQEIPRDAWPGLGAWTPGTYALPLRDVHWLPQPVEFTGELRDSLDAFKFKALPPDELWDQYAHSTTRITERDFRLLTGQA